MPQSLKQSLESAKYKIISLTKGIRLGPIKYGPLIIFPSLGFSYLADFNQIKVVSENDWLAWITISLSSDFNTRVLSGMYNSPFKSKRKYSSGINWG